MRAIQIQPCKCGSQIFIHFLLFKLIKSQNNRHFLIKQTKLVLLRRLLTHVILLVITENILRKWIQLHEKHFGTISYRGLSLPPLYLDWFPVALESSLPHAVTVASNEITVSPVKHTSLVLCGRVCCSVDTTRVCPVVDLLRPILDTFWIGRACFAGGLTCFTALSPMNHPSLSLTVLCERWSLGTRRALQSADTVCCQPWSTRRSDCTI